MGDAMVSSSEIALTSALHIPIAQLQPDLADSSTRSVKAIVTLTWPYSSATGSVAFLLAEPDFRLRKSKGQVRVQFSGSSAKSIAKEGIASGDIVTLSLDGVEFVRDEAAMATPGRGVECELRFAERLLLEFQPEGSEEIKSINIDHPTPETEAPVARVATPEPIIQKPSIYSQNAVNMDEWSSPAFIKRARTSYGSLYDSSYDFLEEEDGNIPGRGRKRARLSSTWRYLSRSPSPEAPQLAENHSSSEPATVAISTMIDEGNQTMDVEVGSETNINTEAGTTEFMASFNSELASHNIVPSLETTFRPATPPTEAEAETESVSYTPPSPRLRPIPSDNLSLVSPLLTRFNGFTNPQSGETKAATIIESEAILEGATASLKDGREDLYGASPIGGHGRQGVETFSKSQNDFETFDAEERSNPEPHQNDSHAEREVGQWQSINAASPHSPYPSVNEDHAVQAGARAGEGSQNFEDENSTDSHVPKSRSQYPKPAATMYEEETPTLDNSFHHPQYHELPYPEMTGPETAYAIHAGESPYAQSDSVSRPQSIASADLERGEYADERPVNGLEDEDEFVEEFVKEASEDYESDEESDASVSDNANVPHYPEDAPVRSRYFQEEAVDDGSGVSQDEQQGEYEYYDEQADPISPHQSPREEMEEEYDSESGYDEDEAEEEEYDDKDRQTRPSVQSKPEVIDLMSSDDDEVVPRASAPKNSQQLAPATQNFDDFEQFSDEEERDGSMSGDGESEDDLEHDFAIRAQHPGEAVDLDDDEKENSNIGADITEDIPQPGDNRGHDAPVMSPIYTDNENDDASFSPIQVDEARGASVAHVNSEFSAHSATTNPDLDHPEAMSENESITMKEVAKISTTTIPEVIIEVPAKHKKEYSSVNIPESAESVEEEEPTPYNQSFTDATANTQSLSVEEEHPHEGENDASMTDILTMEEKHDAENGGLGGRGSPKVTSHPLTDHDKISSMDGAYDEWEEASSRGYAEALPGAGLDSESTFQEMDLDVMGDRPPEPQNAQLSAPETVEFSRDVLSRISWSFTTGIQPTESILQSSSTQISSIRPTVEPTTYPEELLAEDTLTFIQEKQPGSTIETADDKELELSEERAKILIETVAEDSSLAVPGDSDETDLAALAGEDVNRPEEISTDYINARAHDDPDPAQNAEDTRPSGSPDSEDLIDAVEAQLMGEESHLDHSTLSGQDEEVLDVSSVAPDENDAKDTINKSAALNDNFATGDDREPQNTHLVKTRRGRKKKQPEEMPFKPELGEEAAIESDDELQEIPAAKSTRRHRKESLAEATPEPTTILGEQILEGKQGQQDNSVAKSRRGRKKKQGEDSTFKSAESLDESDDGQAKSGRKKKGVVLIAPTTESSQQPAATVGTRRSQRRGKTPSSIADPAESERHVTPMALDISEGGVTQSKETPPRRSRRNGKSAGSVSDMADADESSLGLDDRSPPKGHDASVEMALSALDSPEKDPPEKEYDLREPPAEGLKLSLHRSLRTDLPTFTGLKMLRYNLLKRLDVLAIAVTNSTTPHRAKSGPKQHLVSFLITDPGTAPSNVTEVLVYRPLEEALPIVKAGDAVLLRDFQAISVKGSVSDFGLRSEKSAACSWAVFKDGEAKAEMRGPFVEYGEPEEKYVTGLKEWFAGLDSVASHKLSKIISNKLTAGTAGAKSGV